MEIHMLGISSALLVPCAFPSEECHQPVCFFWEFFFHTWRLDIRSALINWYGKIVGAVGPNFFSVAFIGCSRQHFPTREVWLLLAELLTHVALISITLNTQVSAHRVVGKYCKPTLYLFNT